MFEIPDSDLNNVFEAKDSFLADSELDPTLFDQNEAQRAPHFDHEMLNVLKQYDSVVPELAPSPEINIGLVIKRAGERLDYERSRVTSNTGPQ